MKQSKLTSLNHMPETKEKQKEQVYRSEASLSLQPFTGPWTGKAGQSFKTVHRKEVRNPRFSHVPNHNFNGTQK